MKTAHRYFSSFTKTSCRREDLKAPLNHNTVKLELQFSGLTIYMADFFTKLMVKTWMRKDARTFSKPLKQFVQEITKDDNAY